MCVCERERERKRQRERDRERERDRVEGTFLSFLICGYYAYDKP